MSVRSEPDRDMETRRQPKDATDGGDRVAEAPELNPAENIRQILRQNFLGNRVFENYNAIVEACCDAWNALISMPDRIDQSPHETMSNGQSVSRLV